MRKSFRDGAAFAALCVATFGAFPANAQNAPEGEAAGSGGLGDIVVTAQRRGENLQRTAIAVTAIAPEVLTAKVTTAEDFAKLVPSIVIGKGGGGTNQLTLRGVGAFASNGLTENEVAFNLDGVYLSRPAAANGIFFDLERVEVLKGPQGTLYGRNATAGAVNLITRRPTFELGGDLSVQIGNYDLLQAQGAINLPVSETVAIRLAGQGIRRDGYLTDGYNDQKQYSGRGSILLKPDSSVSLLVTADYAHIGGKGQTNVLSPFVKPSDPFYGPTEPASQAVFTGFTIPTPGGPIALPLAPPQRDGFNDIDVWGVTATLDADLGGGKLTVLPSYRRLDLTIRHYAPGFGFNIIDEVSNERTLEIRYATPEGNRLRAVFGGYYFRETGSFGIRFQVLFPPASSVNIDRYSTRALAAFGQATFDVTDTFRLIGGLRYSDEKKSVRGTSNGQPVLGDLSNNKVNYRAGVEFDAAPHSLLYATVATGFKAGGFYASLPPNTFEPETLTSYTIGSKNRFLDNRLQLNLEAYYWDYRNKQVSHLGPVRPSGVNLITENVGKATIYGAEAEMSFLATPADLISANILYNHARYDRFIYNQTTAVGPPTTTCKVLPPQTGQSAASVNVDCSGNALQQAPEWSVNLGYDHTFRLSNDGSVVFGARSTVRSGYWVGDEHITGQYQKSYITADLDLAYNAPDDRWTIAAYVQNIGDKAIKSTSTVQPVLGRPLVGLYPPRTFGVRAGVKF